MYGPSMFNSLDAMSPRSVADPRGGGVEVVVFLLVSRPI